MINNIAAYINNKYSTKPDADSPLLINKLKNDLPKLFYELGYKKGAEIGVLSGEFSKIICENIPNVKLYCVDPWEIYDDLQDARKSRNYRIQIRRGYNRSKILLAQYSCEIIKKFSLDAVKDFSKESLDFVFIDANHTFDYVMEDIIEWSKIVRPGGIVSGHDYHCFNHREVDLQIQTAVHAYITAHKIKPLFVFTGENTHTWFFVKK